MNLLHLCLFTLFIVNPEPLDDLVKLAAPLLMLPLDLPYAVPDPRPDLLESLVEAPVHLPLHLLDCEQQSVAQFEHRTALRHWLAGVLAA